jgi:hypothetical protein
MSFWDTSAAAAAAAAAFIFSCGESYEYYMKDAINLTAT